MHTGAEVVPMCAKTAVIFFRIFEHHLGVPLDPQNLRFFAKIVKIDLCCSAMYTGLMIFNYYKMVKYMYLATILTRIIHRHLLTLSIKGAFRPSKFAFCQKNLQN